MRLFDYCEVFYSYCLLSFAGIHRFSLTLFNYVLVSVATTFDTESIPAALIFCSLIFDCHQTIATTDCSSYNHDFTNSSKPNQEIEEGREGKSSTWGYSSSVLMPEHSASTGFYIASIVRTITRAAPIAIGGGSEAKVPKARASW